MCLSKLGHYTYRNCWIKWMKEKGCYEGDSPVEEEELGIDDLKYWEAITGLTGAALIAYLITSEGSRLFPPRNLVPIP